MLSAAVYQQIYECAYSADHGTFIEVGTAHAAATVCLALGIQHSKKVSKVYTFERAYGGSRQQYGGVAENTTIIQNNLNHFGVTDLVEVLIGEVADMASAVPHCARVALILLDADGQIDRDLLLFSHHIKSGTSIIIDDYQNLSRVKIRGRACKVDQKHRLTYMLTELFKNNHLIAESNVVNNTFFGTIIDPEITKISTAQILDIYRHLVFAEAEINRPSLKIPLEKIALAIAPSVVDFYRRQRRRRSLRRF